MTTHVRIAHACVDAHGCMCCSSFANAVLSFFGACYLGEICVPASERVIIRASHANLPVGTCVHVDICYIFACNRVQLLFSKFRVVGPSASPPPEWRDVGTGDQVAVRRNKDDAGGETMRV